MADSERDERQALLAGLRGVTDYFTGTADTLVERFNAALPAGWRLVPSAPEAPVDVDTFLAGLDSPNHSPESRRAWVSLMFRDLQRAAQPSAEPLTLGLPSYEERQREVREMIEEADRQDDAPMGPDGLADALTEIADGWLRVALASEPDRPE